jgi:hypothetical protein
MHQNVNFGRVLCHFVLLSLNLPGDEGMSMSCDNCFVPTKIKHFYVVWGSVRSNNELMVRFLVFLENVDGKSVFFVCFRNSTLK